MRPTRNPLASSTLRTALLTVSALLCGIAAGRAGFREPASPAAEDRPASVRSAASSAQTRLALSQPALSAPSAQGDVAPPPADSVRSLFSPLIVPRQDRAAAENRRAMPPAPSFRPPLRAPEQQALTQSVEHSDEEDDEEEGTELALVGVTRVDGSLQAVVEDAGSGLSRSVGEGQVAFGYTVRQVAPGAVVLANRDESRTLVLGENKLQPKVEILGGAAGLHLLDPLNAPLRALPAEAAAAVARVMPKEGVLQRVRPSGSGSSRYYRVEMSIDGLRYELRVSEDGRVLRVSRQVRSTELPAEVVKTANESVPGFQLNSSDTPTLWDRDGRRYYEVEVRKTGGRDEIDLLIAPNGTLIGRD